MDWDDLRYVLALVKAGSLARASTELGVDHTTVGRRVDAAERSLGVKLFTRTPAGYVPTSDAEGLLTPMRAVEAAVLSVERGARRDVLEGPVRVTSPETFGISYLAPRLAAFGLEHPGLSIELNPSGQLLDLGRRQAEIAVRFFRSRQENLVARRAGEVAYGLYASSAYLAKRPVKGELAGHSVLSAGGPNDLETSWLKRLGCRARPKFVSPLSVVLCAAAKAHAGLAVLPRYLGDAEPGLHQVPMPDAPSETVWLTVHRDLRTTPRVRVLLDFLARTLEDDRALLQGHAAQSSGRR